MFKRMLPFLLACALVLAMAAPAMASEQTTLTFAYWGNADELAMKQELIELYMKKNPDVKIEGTYTDGGQYPTKLQTWFASGTAPDVMGIASDIFYPFRDLGVYEDLKPYMEQDGVLDGVWNPIALDVFKDADGHIFGAPYIYKIPAVVYNKTMFDAAGVAYPEKGWTEQQMLDLAQQFTSGSGRDKVYGMRLDWWPSAIYRNLYGNPMYDVNSKTMNAAGNEEFKAALNVFVTMIRDMQVSPDDTMAKAIGGGFETGKFAMAITAPWEMESFAKLIGDKFEWDIVPLPVSEQYGPWHGNLFADGYNMSIDSQNKDAAWSYIKFLTTDPEAQAISSRYGVPMLTSYATSEEYLNEFYGNSPYNKMAFVDMLDQATGWETSGVWAKINDEVSNQYKMVLTGKQDLDTAIANIQAAGEKMLAE